MYHLLQFDVGIDNHCWSARDEESKSLYFHTPYSGENLVRPCIYSSFVTQDRVFLNLVEEEWNWKAFIIIRRRYTSVWKNIYRSFFGDAAKVVQGGWLSQPHGCCWAICWGWAINSFRQPLLISINFFKAWQSSIMKVVTLLIGIALLR